MINPEIYPAGLGKILSNLLALELILRIFVLESEGGTLDSLKNILAASEGDWVPETALTNYDSLKDLVRRSNFLLTKSSLRHQIDLSVINLRDTLAHGRMLTTDPEVPLKLVKFSKADHGKVKVEQFVEITPEWIHEQMVMIASEMKIMASFTHSIGTLVLHPAPGAVF